MTGQQLKNSILQLAVQGKLVPQDPSDEPASVLLERIRAEKEKLIKEGKIKREKNPSVIFRGADNLPYEKVGKNEPVCIADEVPFEIPDSWEWVTLKQIAVSELGKTLDKVKNAGDYCPYLCSINVYWTGIDLSKVKEARFDEAELDKYRLQKGDLLICEGGDVGRAAVWNYDEEMYYQNALHRVRFYGGISPDYFKLVLECYKGNKILDECSKGMTIKHLVQSALNAIYFPLPPITEQHRILSKMAELSPFIEQYARSEKGLSSLNTGFPDKLKKSILQYAVQGKLVPQDPSDEPASALLGRIREEKEQLIKSGKIKRDKHESVIIRRDNSYYENVDGTERCIDEEIPFDVPEGWEWARLKELVQKEIKRGKSPTYIDHSSVMVFAQKCNAKTGVIDMLLAKYLDEKAFSKYPFDEYMQDNDIVINSTGNGTLGRIGIFHDTDRINDCIIVPDSHVTIVRTISFVVPEYIYQVLSYFQSYLEKNCSGSTNQTELKPAVIAELFIPVPPLAEQQRIVAKINEILPALEAL